METEFTDRYGGQAPSWLRACFECEAMGCYPVKETDAAEGYEQEEIARLKAEGRIESDGWYFLCCQACKGTAQASWPTTAARLPRRFLSDLRFAFVEAPQMSEMSYLAAVWLGIKCGLLADLGLWKP